jgi:DNA adenine methylase
VKAMDWDKALDCEYEPVHGPLKWHGGKHYLARKIVQRMPKHLHRVETHCGGCAVTLASDYIGVSEVINDIDGQVTNFWRVLQDPTRFDSFQRMIQAMPMSRREWMESCEYLPDGNPVTEAIAFFVRCRQSLSGRMESFTPITRTRTRRGMNGNVAEWLTSVDGLPEVHQRMRRVLVENMDANALIEREDDPETLFYIDPTYLKETRTAKKVYRHEMSSIQHMKLLELLVMCKGKVMISGYPSKMYDVMLEQWNREEFELPNNAASGKKKRRMTEVLWMNF